MEVLIQVTLVLNRSGQLTWQCASNLHGNELLRSFSDSKQLLELQTSVWRAWPRETQKSTPLILCIPHCASESGIPQCGEAMQARSGRRLQRLLHDLPVEVQLSFLVMMLCAWAQIAPGPSSWGMDIHNSQQMHRQAGVAGSPCSTDRLLLNMAGHGRVNIPANMLCSGLPARRTGSEHVGSGLL